MALIKRLGFFAAPTILMGAGAMMTTGCDDGLPSSEGICGPCGDVEYGAVGISGSAQLDGFFSAVSTLNTASLGASASFNLGLTNLEAAFGLEGSGNLSARVDALVAEIEAEVAANASGGLEVKITPAQCSANINVAVEAQASCEASADCEVTVDPGSAEVTCEGSCTGSCSGECTGEAKCEVDAGGVECSGTCEGSCQVEAGATCEGTCHGECSGTCTVRNAEGNCAGACEGTCEGTCELNAAAECSGTCSGSCTAEPPSGGCEGEVKCEGECSGGCEGGCEGEVIPPSAEGSCEASAECKGQASAQASASMVCTPPAIEVGFEFTGDASAQGEFAAKLGALKANGAIMVESFTKYNALITGEVNGEVAFDPSPIEAVTVSLSGLASAGLDGSLVADLPVGRIDCAIPALTASVTMLGDITSNATATLAAQASFVSAFSAGFDG